MFCREVPGQCFLCHSPISTTECLRPSRKATILTINYLAGKEGELHSDIQQSLPLQIADRWAYQGFQRGFAHAVLDVLHALLYWSTFDYSRPVTCNWTYKLNCSEKSGIWCDIRCYGNSSIRCVVASIQSVTNTEVWTTLPNNQNQTNLQNESTIGVHFVFNLDIFKPLAPDSLKILACSKELLKLLCSL